MFLHIVSQLETTERSKYNKQTKILQTYGNH